MSIVLYKSFNFIPANNLIADIILLVFTIHHNSIIKNDRKVKVR